MIYLWCILYIFFVKLMENIFNMENILVYEYVYII